MCVLQSCLTLWDLMDCSLPGSSVHGVLQARILEWVAMPSSRGSSPSRDWTQVSCTAGGFFTDWATRELGCAHCRRFRLVEWTSKEVRRKFWWGLLKPTGRSFMSRKETFILKERGNPEDRRGLVVGLTLSVLPPSLQWASCPTHQRIESQ